MAFKIIKKDNKEYRKNINPNGRCKYYPELRCVCCNENCDYNVGVDDELDEKLEFQFSHFYE